MNDQQEEILNKIKSKFCKLFSSSFVFSLYCLSVFNFSVVFFSSRFDSGLKVPRPSQRCWTRIPSASVAFCDAQE